VPQYLGNSYSIRKKKTRRKKMCKDCRYFEKELYRAESRGLALVMENHKLRKEVAILAALQHSQQLIQHHIQNQNPSRQNHSECKISEAKYFIFRVGLCDCS
jgi:hypothetical protein